jgi:hypothetical protein
VTRLRSRLVVDLLLRSVAAAGGFATIVARGDDHGGAILIHCCDRGQPGPLLERRFDGQWDQVGPSADPLPDDQQGYIMRRRSVDPDLWVLELDIADAPRFVAQLDPAP